MQEPTRGYPRPQAERAGWHSLDGPWDFAFDRDASAAFGEVRFDRAIEVPFAPESEASGIGDTSFTSAVWYRRRWAPPALEPRERLLLHFGAVDHHATVWVDGTKLGEHDGGYTPFSFELPPRKGPEYEIVVRAFDDPHDLAKPRGKQDWQRHPHSIWYPRTTGIWQTVWVEKVPPAWISAVRWSSNLERWEIELSASVDGAATSAASLRVVLSVGREVLADDVYSVSAREVQRRIALSDPGIDDSRNALLWSPTRPTLIDARLYLLDVEGRIVDEVRSYTALRAVTVQDDQVVLNGRPIRLKMVLDQGYWPDSGLTAPSDAALRRDVELALEMGFNGVRKHQKIEDPRWLYWADRLGLMVWVEMPSAYRFTEASIRRLAAEWAQVIARDSSHPCVIAWVPLNESWGVPNLPETVAQRHYVKALYFLTKTLDPTRPVIGNDGWESVATDIVGVHDYDPDPEAILARYHGEMVRPGLYRRQRYGGRLMVLDERDREHPIVLSEFGGLSLADPDSTLWGYSVATDPEELQTRLESLFTAVRRLTMLAGYCYTQFADTWQEVNGLLWPDRTPKIPLEAVRAMNEGRR